MATAGYSGTPLAGKLGLKPGGTLVLLNAIDGIEDQLAPMPAATVIRRTLASSNQLAVGALGRGRRGGQRGQDRGQ